MLLPLRWRLKAPVRRRDIPRPYPGALGEDELIRTPVPEIMRAFATERRTGNSPETTLLLTAPIRPLWTPDGHLRSRLGKRPDSPQHLSAFCCWQQAGHAEDGNHSNPLRWRHGDPKSIVAARTKRESPAGCRGSLAIRGQSAASRSSRICDKAVRHVDAADGDVPVILLNVPLRPSCGGWDRRGCSETVESLLVARSRSRATCLGEEVS